MSENEIAKIIVDSAYELHVQSGPGMLEKVYQQCLAHIFQRRGLKVEIEKSIPFIFEGRVFENSYRLDLLIEDKVIVEVKSVSELTDVHVAQVITYLKLSKNKLALLINFNVPLIKNGIRRIVNGI
jgi:GxxExxY protein